MSRIEFNEAKIQRTNRSQPHERGLIGWLIKKGVVKNAQSAQLVLLSVIIVSLLLSGILYAARSSEPTSEPTIHPDELLREYHQSS